MGEDPEAEEEPSEPISPVTESIPFAATQDLDEEIAATENEINDLKKNSDEKISKIALDTSSELIKELIGEEVNNSSISAIVEDQSRKNKDRKNVI